MPTDATQIISFTWLDWSIACVFGSVFSLQSTIWKVRVPCKLSTAELGNVYIPECRFVRNGRPVFSSKLCPEHGLGLHAVCGTRQYHTVWPFPWYVKPLHKTHVYNIHNNGATTYMFFRSAFTSCNKTTRFSKHMHGCNHGIIMVFRNPQHIWYLTLYGKAWTSSSE